MAGSGTGTNRETASNSACNNPLSLDDRQYPESRNDNQTTEIQSIIKSLQHATNLKHKNAQKVIAERQIFSQPSAIISPQNEHKIKKHWFKENILKRDPIDIDQR